MAGGGQLIATCTVTYSAPGTHNVTAAYTGDANFAESSSNTVQVTVQQLARGQLKPTPVVTATMEWTFFYTPRFTVLRSLTLSGASVGTQLIITCRGRGCPFARHTKSVAKGIRCSPTARRRCAGHRGPINLTPMFRQHRLRVGTRVTIEIVHPAWIGKYYSFVIQSGRPPRVRISCLAPGATRPGVGC